jgi:LmbE family N-acetylglucosaminyl deacetylase
MHPDASWRSPVNGHPRIRRAAAAAFLLALALPGAPPRIHAQDRPHALAKQDAGLVGLGLAIRRLGTVGSFLQTDAHPDDENNALLTWLTRGRGFRAGVLTLTRGNGGQNEIGPELFEDLAVVRTSELLAAHRLDGADQYFGRAVDFGFSFSTDETFEKWGRREILSDVVRHLRTLRPDVVLAMWLTGEGGGQHHQATAMLTREAFRAAADPAQFPEQIREGLRPWQAKKLYIGGGPPPGSLGAVGVPGMTPTPAAGPSIPDGVPVVTVDANVYDPLLGRTYNEIGWEARSYHKCQGAGQVLPLPGPAPARYYLGDSALSGTRAAAEADIFDGVDTSVTGLSQYVAGPAPQALTEGLSAIAGFAAAARKAFDTSGARSTEQPILGGLAAVRALRAQLAALPIDNRARDEIDLRLRGEDRDFQDAALAAFGITASALSDDGLVIAGQAVKVGMFVANQAASTVRLESMSVTGFAGPASCPAADITAGGSAACTLALQIPPDARPTSPYWKSDPGAARSVFEADVPFGAPFRPSPFRASFTFVFAGQRVSLDRPVSYRYQRDLFAGEKWMEVHVVPAFSVATEPALAVVPAAATGAARRAARDVQVSVTSGLKGASEATVSIDAPDGWTVTPKSVRVMFLREDESRTARFSVTVPVAARTGSYVLRARVVSPALGAQVFDRGYQVVEYPHIERRHVINPAQTTVRVTNVRVVPGVRVGYVSGVGDQVVPALEQLGATVTLLGSDDLARGDLSKYDVVMTGVRAYERREDLRAYNRRVLDFAERGGTVIVQYNKAEFNQAQYGPYPARVGGGRVTDERSPVVLLRPSHPVFGRPNAIGERTWQNWVQERGLYFLGEKDARYTDLVRLADPFPFNAGDKLGALVEARVGQGRWLYLGLGLWRQLPAGTEGAYELLANLIALSKSPIR